APCVFRAFDRHALPDISRPRKRRSQLLQSLASLRQDLKRVPMSLMHDVEDSAYVVDRHIFVEQVAHAVDKDGTWPTPAQRKEQQIRMKCYGEAVAIPRVLHRTETHGKAFGVTVLAAGTDLRAARDGIPSRLSPLDTGSLAHGLVSLLRSSSSAASLNGYI